MKSSQIPPPPSNSEEQAYKQMVQSTSPWKILFPLLLGLGFIGYMFWSKFDAQEFQKIEWSVQAFTWIGIAALFMVLRHFFYMLRLRIITDQQFSWRKAFQLIMIWEFSSAVTPSSVGGSAVSMFVLAREKIPGGKSAMIVMYTIVVDTLFYLSMLLLYLQVFGDLLIQPQAIDDQTRQVLKNTFWGAYGFMFLYGSLFAYGVLVSPKGLQKLLLWICKIPFLQRFQDKVIALTQDMNLASSELRQKSLGFHVSTFLATAGAWSCRFLVFNCLAMGFIVASHDPEIHGYYEKFMNQAMQFNFFTEHIFMMARQQAMYVLMAIMPTPGGSGGVEYAFLQYHSDYVAKNGSLEFVLALAWRLLTYYIYLILGYITVVRWLGGQIQQNQSPNTETKP